MASVPRLALVVFVAVTACGTGEEPESGSTETDATTLVPTSSGGTEAPIEHDTYPSACREEACAIACQDRNDECLQPLTGACVEGRCECSQAVACPPCVDEECGEPWLTCTSDHGVCFIDCVGVVPVSIDPGTQCQITVTQIPETLRGGLNIDGAFARRVETCSEDDVEATWSWQVEPDVMLICPPTCGEVSEETELEVTWAWPCE